jgi:DNA/RNA endonuclease G (NUC1)
VAAGLLSWATVAIDRAARHVRPAVLAGASFLESVSMSLVLPRDRRLLAALCVAAVGASCAEPTVPAPQRTSSAAPRLGAAVAAAPSVHISEFHYDNDAGDVNEAIEVTFPSSTSLSGWRIVRYNGNTAGAAVTYATPAATTGEDLGAITPVACTDGVRSVVVVRYNPDGLQNGLRDGFALVNGTTVVELLSYEGVFTASTAATGGPAAGMTSVDIGVSEAGNEGVNNSLSRDAATDTWTETATNSIGACNAGGGGPVIGPLDRVTVSGPTTVNVGASITLTALAEDADGDDITAGTVVWSGGSPNVTVTPTGDRTATVTGDVAGGPVTITATLTVDAVTRSDDHPVTVNGGAPSATNVRISEFHYDDEGGDLGEAIEVEGDAGGSLSGWSLVLYNATGGVSYATIPLTGTLGSACAGNRGVLSFDAVGLQNGPNDGIALVNNVGQVVEFLSYEGTLTANDGPAAGMTSTDVGVDEDPAPADGNSLQRAGNGVWFGPAAATFGACNPATPPTPPAPGLLIIGRAASDPPLPIGYQDQLFAQSPPGTTLPHAQVTWSVDPSTPFATVDNEGVVTGTATGTAIVRATRISDGATGSASLPIGNPPDGPAVYSNHLEFGRPLDATPADDILVTWPEFVSSYNPNRGQPNWIAYNLEQTHRGPADRCECFTHDPSLPPSVPVLNTDDYTGSGYSRGHMVMSEDRTSGPSSTQTSVDNARTFLFSNIVPQTAENNGGPWLTLETYLGGLAEGGTKEIYIYAGGAAYSGTLKNEGKVAIPTRTWKIAVIVDRDEGLANVATPADVEVIAVDMPNTTTVSGDWTAFRVSVDHVEALTGYDFLSALPDNIEAIVEAQQSGVRNVDINIQPSQISVSTTPVVNVVLFSSATFDAVAVNAADVRLIVNGGTAVAPIVRGTTVNTSVADVNGDGRPDRQIGFATSALRAAGLAPGASSLVLRPLGTPPAWEGHDITPPTVVP